MRQLRLRDTIVILCAYLQNYVLTYTWAGPGHSGTSCQRYLCVHISRALRGQRETIQLRLDKPCQCKQNSYQFERNIDFYITFLFSQQIYKDVAQKTHDYILTALLCNLERCPLLRFFFSHVK